MLIRRSAGLDTPPRNYAGATDIRLAEKVLRDVGLSKQQAKRVLAVGWDVTFSAANPAPGRRDAGPATAEPGRDALSDLLLRLKQVN